MMCQKMPSEEQEEVWTRVQPKLHGAITQGVVAVATSLASGFDNIL